MIKLEGIIDDSCAVGEQGMSETSGSLSECGAQMVSLPATDEGRGAQLVGAGGLRSASPALLLRSSCAGCRKPIRDKFIFSVIEQHWHQDCVKCSDCSLKLNERCYTFEGKLFCKLDYWRRFGPKCFACGEPIGRQELVQRIKGNRVYHLKCFTCNCCQKQLEAGEQLHLIDDMKLMCKQDFSQLGGSSCSSSAAAAASASGVMRAAPAGGNSPTVGVRPSATNKSSNGFLNGEQGRQTSSYNYTTLTSGRENRASAPDNKSRLASLPSDKSARLKVELEANSGERRALDRQEGVLAEDGRQGDEEEAEEAEAEELEEEDELAEGEEDEEEELEELEELEEELEDEELGGAGEGEHGCNLGRKRQLAGYGRQLDNNNLENEENRSSSASYELQRLEGAKNNENNETANGQQVSSRQKRHYAQHKQQSAAKRKGRRRQKAESCGRKQLLSRNNGESILNGLQASGPQQTGSILSSPTSNQLNTMNPMNPMQLQASQPQQQHHSGHHQRQVSSPTSIGRHGSSAGHKPTRVRTVLNEKQLALLRECYQQNPRPDALRKESLVEETGLSARVIRVWFQVSFSRRRRRRLICK